jgi:hypothetical protein
MTRRRQRRRIVARNLIARHYSLRSRGGASALRWREALDPMPAHSVLSLAHALRAPRLQFF